MGNEPTATFGKRLLALRKQRGWSQPQLAKKLGTSGAIIGRYERAEMTPSIEVANKLAEVLQVTIDYLVGGHNMDGLLKDRAMLARWQALDELPDEDRERILYVVDGLVRDARARQTYRATG